MRDTRPHIKLCYVQRNFTGYTQPLDRAYMRAFKSSIRQEVAKHFAEFFLEVESNFERVNLDSSTAVLRQLLLSLVHTAAQDADSPQHRTAGWRFIDWNEVEQRELLAEAKRLLETGRTVFHEAQQRSLTRQMPRPKPATASQRRMSWSHWQTITAATTARTRPLVSRNQRHQRHQRRQQLPAAPKRAAMSLLERLQAIRIIYGSTPPS